MRNLIYQYWGGDMPCGVLAGKKNMEEYAKRIGAEYRLDHNKPQAVNTGVHQHYWEWLNPLIDPSFLVYDNIAIIDLDVFAVDGLEESIFDLEYGHVAACREPAIETIRKETLHGSINYKNDEIWAAWVDSTLNTKLPRRDDGLLKVYNAGMVMFSKEGLRHAKNRWWKFNKYVQQTIAQNFSKFYCLDQNYFHAMAHSLETDFTELDYKWNSHVHNMSTRSNPIRRMNDTRPKDAKLVHIQPGEAKWYTEKEMWRITNLPIQEWNLNHKHYKAAVK